MFGKNRTVRGGGLWDYVKTWKNHAAARIIDVSSEFLSLNENRVGPKSMLDETMLGEELL